ncbi:MAG: hypothetical protein IKN71_00845 [Alphaproteobacteria bacterium]|nr:hypothetical protein [Alphaproteobacteria bacterium]
MKNKPSDITEQEIKAWIISKFILVCLIFAFAVCGYCITAALGIGVEERGGLIGMALLIFIILLQEKGALPKDFLETPLLDKISENIFKWMAIMACVLAVVALIAAFVLVCLRGLGI